MVILLLRSEDDLLQQVKLTFGVRGQFTACSDPDARGFQKICLDLVKPQAHIDSSTFSFS